MPLYFEIVFALGVVIWMSSPLFGRVLVSSFRRLENVPVPPMASLPKLSVIIAACNEEETIADALRTILKQDYPNLEIIIVNDRSTDKTGEFIASIAAEDPRVVDLHLESLPDGWLGKVHALHQATAVATGDWMLFTDADVHYHGDVLRHVIALGELEQLDHVALLPKLSSRSFFARCAIASAVRGLAITVKPWRIRDPNCPESIASGAFNLVRRTAFERTPGFEWLRMEVVDDIGLAQMIKAHGGRADLLVAIDSVSVEWYSSLRGLVLGLEKNAFAQIARFSLLRGLCIVLLITGYVASPFALLAFGSHAAALPVALFGFAAAGVASIQYRRITGDSAWMVFASFLIGDLVLAFVCFRASILGFLRGGVIWRGTVYPSAQLKDGVRVKI